MGFAEVSREFRGTRYSITIKNPEHISKGVLEIHVDGMLLKGNILPLFTDVELHQVEIILTALK